MTDLLKRGLLPLLLTALMPMAVAQVPGGSGSLNPSQLAILQDLSPQDREALLDSLIEGADTNQEQLSFPDLLQREGLAEEEEEPAGLQIFDAEGRPILDSSGEAIYLTEKALRDMQVQSPDDWLENNAPFFQQDIKLQRFGYDLFEGVPTTFAPATDIPVPNEYSLGPGDTIDVQLFGKENRQYSLVVNRDGTINFPSIGPVNVIGQTFQELKQAILDRVAEQLIGTSASVSMGSLRSINVLIVGDARRPGSYTVSGLSTITNALLVSGGVGEVGSLRNIELKREGKVISKLDLYDLLLRGDASKDLRLESGDVIFIPPVGSTVSVGGFVKRPAIYELRGEKTAAQIVSLAGGLRPDAFPSGARLERINADRERAFINLDLENDSGADARMQSGDVLLVPPVLRSYRDGVRLLGHVGRPGVYEWTPGMRLTDLIVDMQALLPQADLNYVVIRRETRPDRRIRVLSANLQQALANPASAENIQLDPRDEVSVFVLEGRADDKDTGDDADELSETEVAYVLGQLAAREQIQQGLASSQSSGLPASFDSRSLRRSDLNALGVSLPPRDIKGPSTSQSRRRDRVDELLSELQLQAGADDPFQRVSISGEVRAEGDYPYEASMTVADLVRAAGGFTESAYPMSAELTRYDIVNGNFRSSELVEIDLSAALSGDPAADIVLGPSDFLTVRRIQNWDNEMTVFLDGEIRYPGTYTIKPGETLSTVLERAGGLTDQAFAEGGIFLREELRQREQEQIDASRARLQSDLATLTLQAAGSLQGASAVDARSAGSALLATLNRAEATGRLVIDLPAIIEKASVENDVLLKDGDRLLIPRRTQAVTVIGEVQFPTSHLYAKGLKRDDYIGRSGGVTPNAAKKNVYLVRANGAVYSKSGSWRRNATRVEPGDTIVVPLDTQKGFRLQSWANITSIVYNAAIAVAAINGL